MQNIIVILIVALAAGYAAIWLKSMAQAVDWEISQLDLEIHLIPLYFFLAVRIEKGNT